MPDPVEPLILDLLEWIGPHSRPYAEVLDAWRTSCPRLPVWEEANRRGLVDHLHGPGQPARVAVSALGQAQLAARRAASASSSRYKLAAMHDKPIDTDVLCADIADPLSADQFQSRPAGQLRRSQ